MHPRLTLGALPLLLVAASGCRTADKPDADSAGLGADLPADDDGDGYDDTEDCDDADASTNPGATEVCDGVDNDCDGAVDEGVMDTWYADADADGYGDPGAATDACDAPPGHAPTATDCDDTDPAVYPSAAERCDSVDNDCDGDVDEDVQGTWFADADADGFGDAGAPLDSCDPPDGFVADDEDCDDTEPTTNPDGIEVCDDQDNDCDGLTDEADATDAPTWFADVDGDGYGDPDNTAHACDVPTGFVDQARDCDDRDFDISPDADEVCDGVDNDCDGLTDDADPSLDRGTGGTWYADTDADGHGDAGAPSQACTQPTGTVTAADDCDDTDPAVSPSATEICNGIDDDCDGDTDDDDASVDTATGATWYADTDADGHGDPSASSMACGTPAGSVADATDCDDTDPDVHPGATEVCSASDDDCDATTSQAGLARFVTAAGAETDLAATLGAGSSSAAVEYAPPSDGTLWICEGTWHVTLSVDGDTVDILGPDGSALTVLDGASDGPVLDVRGSAEVTFTGFTVQNGAAAYGGGVAIDQSTFGGADLVITDNEAFYLGGGVFSWYAEVTLDDVLITSNLASAGGGACVYGDGGWSGGVALSSSAITDNEADEYGGGLAIYGSADVSVSDVDVSGNAAGISGGGVYFSSGSLDLDTCTIDDNSAESDGGGLYGRDDIVGVDVTFDANTAGDDGGGLYLDLERNEDVDLSGSLSSSTGASSSSVSGNAASDDGPGMYIRIRESDGGSSGSVTVDLLDFGTDDVQYNADNDGTLTPGDGASFQCNYRWGCY